MAAPRLPLEGLLLCPGSVPQRVRVLEAVPSGENTPRAFFIDCAGARGVAGRLFAAASALQVSVDGRWQPLPSVHVQAPGGKALPSLATVALRLRATDLFDDDVLLFVVKATATLHSLAYDVYMRLGEMAREGADLGGYGEWLLGGLIGVDDIVLENSKGEPLTQVPLRKNQIVSASLHARVAEETTESFATYGKRFAASEDDLAQDVKERLCEMLALSTTSGSTVPFPVKMDEEALKELRLLTEHDAWTVLECGMGGHCIYACIAHSVYGCAGLVYRVRHELADALRARLRQVDFRVQVFGQLNEQPSYKGLNEDELLAKFVEDVRSTDEWAEGDIMRAVAEVRYERPIVIYDDKHRLTVDADVQREDTIWLYYSLDDKRDKDLEWGHYQLLVREPSVEGGTARGTKRKLSGSEAMDVAREKISGYPTMLWLLCHAPRSTAGDEAAMRAAIESKLDAEAIETVRDGASWSDLCNLFALFLNGSLGLDHVHVS